MVLAPVRDQDGPGPTANRSVAATVLRPSLWLEPRAALELVERTARAERNGSQTCQRCGPIRRPTGRLRCTTRSEAHASSRAGAAFPRG